MSLKESTLIIVSRLRLRWCVCCQSLWASRELWGGFLSKEELLIFPPRQTQQQSARLSATEPALMSLTLWKDPSDALILIISDRIKLGSWPLWVSVRGAKSRRGGDEGYGPWPEETGRHVPAFLMFLTSPLNRHGASFLTLKCLLGIKFPVSVALKQSFCVCQSVSVHSVQNQL